MELTKERRNKIREVTKYFSKKIVIALSTIEEQIENLQEDPSHPMSLDRIARITELLIQTEWLNLEKDYFDHKRFL